MGSDNEIEGVGASFDSITGSITGVTSSGFGPITGSMVTGSETVSGEVTVTGSGSAGVGIGAGS